MSTDFYDYYALLELGPTASVEEIKAKRRKLLNAHFVDKHQGCETSLEVTLRLNQIKEVLLVEKNRRSYDLAWHRHHFRSKRTSPDHEEGVHPLPGEVVAPLPRQRSRSGLLRGLLVGGGVLAVGSVVLAAMANEYDDRADRFRGRDGKFRKGRFSR